MKSTVFRIIPFLQNIVLETNLCVVLVVFLLLSVRGFAGDAAMVRREYSEVHMGVPVRIVIYADRTEIADNAAKSAMERFQKLNDIMSDYDSESELSRLCLQSTEAWRKDEKPIWIPVSEDLFHVMRSSRHWTDASEGAFDITISPLSRLWRRSRRMKELPKSKYIEEAKKLVGRDLWELDSNTRSVRLLRPGMRLDLGGIAKGYAIDQAFEKILRHGIEMCLVDAGGDFRVGKAPPEGWRIESDDEFLVSKFEKTPIENFAMATSGDQFQFVVIDGVRYSHLIDPKTGLGMTQSLTTHIVAENATDADALASAVSILGPEKGLRLIESQKKTSMKMILHGGGRVIQSENWPFRTVDSVR